MGLLRLCEDGEVMGLYNFKKRFAPFVLDGSKTHTIRAKRRYPSEPGETLYLYTGLRQKGAQKLREAECVRVEDIRVTERQDVFIDNQQLDRDECDALAYRDGFRERGVQGAFALMMEFWEGRLPFRGDIIHWKVTR